MAVIPKAESLADDVHSSDWLDHAVRAGLVAYAVVHLLVAWIALQLAFGDQSGSASSSGALQTLTEQPLGGVLVWLVALGMFLLVAWRLLEAVTGHEDEDGASLWRKRAGSVLKAAIYGAIGVSAVQVATASGGSQKGGGTDSTTKTLMDLPAGQLLVGLVALAIAGYGLSLVYRAWTEKFAEHLDAEGRSGDSGTAYLWFGKAGYNAKGLAIVVVGGLFGYAAVTHDADKSGGLDQALQQVREQPYGQALLVAVALGIACYGLFTLARARHLSR